MIRRELRILGRPILGVSAGAFVIGFAVLHVPLAVLILQSFQETSSQGGGSTLRWYPAAFAQTGLWSSVVASLLIGCASATLSALLGTAAALALEGTPFPGRRLLDALLSVPLFLPEVLLGIALLAWFVFLRIRLGALSVVLAHTVFGLSTFTLTLRARLASFDGTLIEAARDLGASPWQAFVRVRLPLILPGIVSGWLLAFALSFDDFLVTFFVSGSGMDTLPVRIYAMIKFGIGREVHAASTLLVAATAIPVVLALAWMRPSGERVLSRN